MTSNAGIHNPTVIDLVTLNHKAGDVRLIMVQTDSWDGSARETADLEEKAKTYVAYALGGQLVRTYPEAAGRPVTIQLDSARPPEGHTAAVIAGLKERLQKAGIRFELNILP
jgi:hypothetical protein